MNHLGKILICLFLSLVCILPAVAEGNQQAASSKLAMDVVMVIDASNSMRSMITDAKGVNRGNDPQGYRLDAAAMLLGMCDAEYSRASVILFAGKVMTEEKWAQKLYPIALNAFSSTRSTMIEDINTKYRSKLAGNTDLGGALLTAVELLAKEGNSTNAPVVVLLTDGQISFQNNGVTDQNAEKESLDKFSSAVRIAKEKGIRIYSVALKPETEKFSTDLLEAAAMETNGVFSRVNKSEDLPEVFNNVFANQVGSEVVTLASDTTLGANGEATTTLSIPNKSVAEANILIPVGMYYDAALIGPSGQKEFDNTRYIKYVTRNCTFIKIINPHEVGDWTVTYKNKQGLKNISTNLRINVVFSYDVVTDFSFKKTTAYKTDEQTVTVKFKKPDGTFVDDTSLYMGAKNDGQTGIMVEGNVINEEGELVNREPIQFTKTPEGFVYNGIINHFIPGVQQGEYRFVISMKGDGMDTSAVSQPFKVVNLAPVYKTEQKIPEWNPVIHDPVKDQATYEKEAEHTINLDDYVIDPDEEKVSYKLSRIDNEKVVSAELRGSNLVMQTKNLTGMTQVRVVASDGNENGDFEISIPVSVNNIRQHILENYKLEVTTEGNINEKHQQIMLIGKVKDNGTDVQDPTILNLIAANTTGIVLERKPKNSEAIQSPLHFEAMDGTIKASFETDNISSTYTVSGEVFLLPDIQLQQVIFPEAFTVLNQAPKLCEGVTTVNDSRTIHNLLEPSDEAYLQKYTNVFRLREYFEDPDGDPNTTNHLTYQAETYDGDGNDISEAVTLKINDETDELSVETDQNGLVVLKVTGTDVDGDTAKLEIRIDIDNRQTYMAEHYTITVSREGEAAKLPEKNATYSYVARLVEDGTTISDPQVLQYVDLSGLRVERTRGEVTQSDSLKFENENDIWRSTARTYPQERTYQIAGDPLVRGVIVNLQAEEPFTLENHEARPVRGENPAANMIINDVTLPEDAEKIPSVDIDLNSFFLDEDQEKLTFTATLAKGGDVADLKLSGDYVTVIPKGITGEAVIHVLARDESDGVAETDIPIRITNVETAIANDWKAGFEFIPTQDGKEPEVGDEVFLRATIDMHDTPELSQNVYELAETNLTLTRIESESGEETTEQLAFHVNGKALETEPFTLSKQEANYVLAGEMTIKGINVKLDSEKVNLPIGNVPPVVHPEIVLGVEDSEEQTGYPTTFTIHPFLWGKKDESEFTIRLNEVFTDTPNDQLTYGAAFVSIPEGDASEPDVNTMVENTLNGAVGYRALDTIRKDTGELILAHDQDGDFRLLLYATDSSKKSEGIVYRYTVISQRKNILILLAEILAGVIVLIILILLIYWSIYRKAWKASFGTVNMSVNGTPRMSGINFPQRGKGDAFLGSLRIKEAAAGDGNISRQLDLIGRKYKLRPKQNGVVSVRQADKRNSDFSVSVNGRNMTRAAKKAEWAPNGIVKLTYTKPDVNLTIELSRVSGGHTVPSNKPAVTSAPISSGKPKL